MAIGCGAEVIFDPVDGNAYSLSTECVTFEGSILIIGFDSLAIASRRQYAITRR